MSTRLKLVLFATVAFTAIAGAGTATAASITVTRGGNITAASLGRVTFTGGILSPSCNLTLTGSLATGPIEKVDGAVFGHITGINYGNCSNSTIVRVLELPWPLTYRNIRGTLPNAVTGLTFDIGIAAFLLAIDIPLIGSMTCLYRGAAAAQTGAEVALAGTNPYTTGLIGILRSSIPLNPSDLNSVFCPSEGGLSGSFGLTPQQTLIRH